MTDNVEPAHVSPGVEGLHVPLTSLHTAYRTAVVVPENDASGANETRPLAWFKVHVPSPATVSEVLVQPVALPVVCVSPAPHRRSVERSRVTSPCRV